MAGGRADAAGTQLLTLPKNAGVYPTVNGGMWSCGRFTVAT